MKAVVFPRALEISAVALALSLPFTASAEECVMSTNQPVLDFKHTQRAQLLEGTREGQRLLVDTRVINLDLNCAVSTAMAVSFNGERSGDQGYRFSQDGVFTLKVLSAQLDDKSVRLMVHDSAVGAKDSDNQIRPGVKLVAGDLGQIARGSKFSAQVEVKAYVDDRNGEVRSPAQWDGGGHFSIDTF